MVSYAPEQFTQERYGMERDSLVDLRSYTGIPKLESIELI